MVCNNRRLSQKLFIRDTRLSGEIVPNFSTNSFTHATTPLRSLTQLGIKFATDLCTRTSQLNYGTLSKSNPYNTLETETDPPVDYDWHFWLALSISLTKCEFHQSLETRFFLFFSLLGEFRMHSFKLATFRSDELKTTVPVPRGSRIYLVVHCRPSHRRRLLGLCGWRME